MPTNLNLTYPFALTFPLLQLTVRSFQPDPQLTKGLHFRHFPVTHAGFKRWVFLFFERLLCTFAIFIALGNISSRGDIWKQRTNYVTQNSLNLNLSLLSTENHSFIERLLL